MRTDSFSRDPSLAERVFELLGMEKKALRVELGVRPSRNKVRSNRALILSG